MKKEIVYSLKKDVPHELSLALCKHIDNRDFNAKMIAHYTTKWIKEQQEIIRINNFIQKRR
jgi:hypothetical protein